MIRLTIQREGCHEYLGGLRYDVAEDGREKGNYVGIADAGPKERTSDGDREPSQVSRTGLDALFLPASVAVIGATERHGAVGRTVLTIFLQPLQGGVSGPDQLADPLLLADGPAVGQPSQLQRNFRMPTSGSQRVLLVR